VAAARLTDRLRCLTARRRLRSGLWTGRARGRLRSGQLAGEQPDVAATEGRGDDQKCRQPDVSECPQHVLSFYRLCEPPPAEVFLRSRHKSTAAWVRHENSGIGRYSDEIKIVRVLVKAAKFCNKAARLCNKVAKGIPGNLGSLGSLAPEQPDSRVVSLPFAPPHAHG
jgi:hypothetical protein